MNEQVARAIFQAAMNEGRCGELLDALFAGASATCNDRGELVIIPADVIQQAMEQFNR